MANTSIFGWDIGGAHIKLARIRDDGTLQSVMQYPCPLWRGLAELEQALRDSVADNASAKDYHAVTMSGELTDAFANRREGVEKIAALVNNCLPVEHPEDIKFYAGRRGFVNATDVERYALDIASANWYATAQFVATQLERGILIDMGSTTTDIIAFCEGHPIPRAFDDRGRLASAELVYSGLTRTPLMAIADRFEINGQQRPVMAEMFATTADIYRVLGILPEEADMYPSCDGADKDMPSSARRIARMFGCDYDQDLSAWKDVAQVIADTQHAKIATALETVAAPLGGARNTPIIAVGAGHFVITDIVNRLAYQTVASQQLLDPHAQLPELCATKAIECATAVSIAYLAKQHKESDESI